MIHYIGERFDYRLTRLLKLLLYPLQIKLYPELPGRLLHISPHVVSVPPQKLLQVPDQHLFLQTPIHPLVLDENLLGVNHKMLFERPKLGFYRVIVNTCSDQKREKAGESRGSNGSNRAFILEMLTKYLQKLELKIFGNIVLDVSEIYRPRHWRLVQVGHDRPQILIEISPNYNKLHEILHRERCLEEIRPFFDLNFFVLVDDHPSHFLIQLVCGLVMVKHDHLVYEFVGFH